jgi:Baseplate J-like protein
MVETSVPSPVFGPQGFIAPLESAINTGTTEDIAAAFATVGLSLNPSPATPQGQIAATQAAIVGNNNNLFLQFTNWVDPALSQGRMQDAIGRIYFIERIPSSPTTAQCVCTGLAGVVIPTGAQAQAADGNIYICTAGGTIPITGSITLPFACQTYGPIVCPADTIQTIYQAIPGWDSIANPVAGIEGRATETPQQFEQRRGLSVAHNSQGWLAAVVGAVLSVPNVLDAFATENNSASAQAVGGVTLLPFSIYVAVVGGDEQAVANAIFTTKSPGSLYNGNTNVTVYDENPLYAPPFPSYNVKFEVPTPLPFFVAVTMVNDPQTPSNALTLVQNAVIAAFAGEDGGPRARIGSTVYASRFYAGISAAWPGATIIEILIGTTNDATAAQFTGTITGTTLTVTSITTGTIAAGMAIFDQTGLLTPGTTILGGSGSTWTVSASQTVANENMTGVLADSFSQRADIDQVPAITAANIILNLQ